MSLRPPTPIEGSPESDPPFKVLSATGKLKPYVLVLGNKDVQSPLRGFRWLKWLDRSKIGPLVERIIANPGAYSSAYKLRILNHCMPSYVAKHLAPLIGIHDFKRPGQHYSTSAAAPSSLPGDSPCSSSGAAAFDTSTLATSASPSTELSSTTAGSLCSPSSKEAESNSPPDSTSGGSSPSDFSNRGKEQGKPTRKVPGRTLIRPGTGLTKAQKALIVVPPQLQQVITGMILGDGHLQLRGSLARFTIGLKDKEFAYHLWDLFNSIGIVGAEPYCSTSVIKPSGNLSVTYHFVTFTLPYFTHLYHNWYRLDNGKKVKALPSNIDELLTPVALAYWISSDGSYNKTQGAVIIHTESFSPDEVEILRSILSDKFNIDSTRCASPSACSQGDSEPCGSCSATTTAHSQELSSSSSGGSSSCYSPNSESSLGTLPGTGLSEAEKAAIVFTDKIKELITGVILGDGYIRMVGTEARLEVQQKDKEFVLLLWEVFDSIGLVGAKPKELSSFLKETAERITPIALAFWVSGDGAGLAAAYLWPPPGRKAGGAGPDKGTARQQEPDKGTARQLSRESDSKPLLTGARESRTPPTA
ncbi:3631_t:CDS:2 [Entrophospora sp. SA101]|nr:3631_t:CDS:2 [Entrophospora sp. SA101]